MCVPSVENPTCTLFKEYEYVTKMAPLDFTKDGVI